MKKLIVIIVALSLFLLCGCSGYQEINRGYLVSAIGISKKDSVYSVFVEALYSSEVLDSSVKRVCFSATEVTLASAFETLNESLAKPLYFEQLGLLVLEEGAVDDGIVFLGNITNVNYGVYVVKTDDMSALFSTDNTDSVLGYDIISLIKKLPKNLRKGLSCQFYQTHKNGFDFPLVNVKDNNFFVDVSGD